MRKSCFNVTRTLFFAITLLCLAVTSAWSALPETNTLRLQGTYNFFNQDSGFWQYTGDTSPEISGATFDENTAVTFDGVGHCQLNEKFYALRYDGWTPAQPWPVNLTPPAAPCTYTVSENGRVVLYLGGEVAYQFQLSDDNQSVVFGDGSEAGSPPLSDQSAGITMSLAESGDIIAPAISAFYPNPYSGPFSTTQAADTCGEWGLSNMHEVGVSVAGDVLTIVDSVEGIFGLNRVVADPENPLIGVWFAGNPNQVNSTVIIAFVDDGHFLMIQDGDSSPAGDPSGQDGIERGTYTWNPTTGVYATTSVPVDTNGEWGLSNMHEVTMAANGNTLTITDSSEGIFTLQRLVPTPENPLIGGWLAGNPAGVNDTVLIAFVDNSHYLFAQDGDSSPAGDPNGQDGMEKGSYNLTPTVHSLTVDLTLTALDDSAVTGYFLAQSSTPPVAATPGWMTTAPTSYTFATAGSQQLYAWVRDAAGNISSAANGTTVEITLSSAALPGTLTVPATDADRTYKVSWLASATAGSTYVLQESTSSDFSTDLLTLYSGSKLSYIVTDRNFATRYYYRVKATKTNFTDSAWTVAANSCDTPVAPPGLVTSPNADADGNYSVSWVASATPGVTYTLSEASDSAFTVGLRKVYEGPDTNVNVIGRAQGKTYYYRVRANLTGLPSSAWKIRLKGCAVPGSVLVATPGVPLVPASDSDGSFTVSWSPSATADVTYELQQATNSAFNVGAFIAYRGTATTIDLTGRAAGKTFYYRVRAIKAGLEDSGFKAAANGCLVGP